MREFVHDYNIDYRIGWSGQDVAVTLMQGRDAIPQSFIISRDGRIIKRFVGFNPTHDAAANSRSDYRKRSAAKRRLIKLAGFCFSEFPLRFFSETFAFFLQLRIL